MFRNKKQTVDFSAAPRYAVLPEYGLDETQIRERQENGYANFDAAIKTKSVPRIIASHLMTLFNLVNIIIAFALIYVGSYKNLAFLLVITANVLIGVVQEIRAKRATDKLSFVSKSKVRVIRSGDTVSVGTEEILLDDVVALRSGDQICVDCVVLTGECEVNESFVTGESDAVFKRAGDVLLAGSFVTSGECRARADKIADRTYISSISRSAKKLKTGKSVLMRSFKRLISVISAVIFPLGALLFFDQYRITGSFGPAVVSTSASLLAMIPQGLVLLTSSALALSVVRLSRRKVLVKDLYSVEMLARVDTVCLDKTGTLTEGRLNAEGIVKLDEASEPEKLLALLAGELGEDNATMEAVARAFPGGGSDVLITKVPFSSKTKWSGCAFKNAGSVILGAAEYIMPQNAAVLEKVREYAAENRVLLLCTSGDTSLAPGVLPQSLRPAALVLLRDSIRKEAPGLIKYLVSQDVRVRIISGDNPMTVASIARACGVPDAEKYIDCSTLKTDEEVAEAADRYAVFGRVTPFQKKLLIKALKAKGRTVAMTGDGVNDMLAMKESDCSVAMGGGTDAACSVATLVLLRSDFDSLPHVINEGRRSVNNIQRSASFFLSKTIYATLIAFLLLVLHRMFPLQPIQMSLISFACIGFPSVVLAFEPNHDRIKGNFLRNVLVKALPGGVTVALATVLCISVNDIAALFEKTDILRWAAVTADPPELATMVLYVMGFVSYLVLLSVCRHPTLIDKVLLVLVALAFVGGVLLFGGMLEIVPLSLPQIIVTSLICAAAAPVMTLLMLLMRKIRRKEQ
ncbi:MAG: HAD-IC family P-type ATPase [Clostridia bacterium]|nr:HAD-IC family P-type ATPase [Clostridia bacterium]